MVNSLSSIPQSFGCADLQLDLALGVVANAAGDTQRLSPINLKLLTYLLQRQGEVISRADLFAVIWPNQIVSDDVLTRAISDIRTQLARLDGSTRFIETLPKRGYRWAEPVVITASSATEVVNSAPTDVVAKPLFWESAYIFQLMGYGLASVVLAGIFMIWLSHSMAQPVVRLALLPAVIDQPIADPVAQVLNEELAQLLRKKPHIKLLSKTAVAARPANPFPYFFNEFSAQWVLESRVNNIEGSDSIELSLIDARTGLEVRSLHFGVATPAAVGNLLAKKLELLQELQ